MRRMFAAVAVAVTLFAAAPVQRTDAGWWNQQYVAIRLDCNTLEVIEGAVIDGEFDPLAQQVVIVGPNVDAGTIFQLNLARFGDLIVPVSDASAVLIGENSGVGIIIDADGNVVSATAFVASDPLLDPIDLLGLF